MRFDHARFHLEQMDRRAALKLGAGAAAAAAATQLGGASAHAGRPDDAGPARGRGEGKGRGEGRGASGGSSGAFTDEMFDVDAVLAGAWVPSPYGADDQRGTLNELTPERTAAAMRRVRGGQVTAYQLGEEMFNGFPAYPSTPPRLHEMYLLASGYDAGPEFVAGGGIQSGTTPAGPNLVTGHEERFAENFTFQIGTQLDGLGHVGVGDIYYNGFRAQELSSPTGLTALGNETMGPIATRGVVLDIVGLKVAGGMTDDYFIAPNGRPVLRDDYRITIDDIENAVRRERIQDGIRPGDVPIFHTGWTHLVRDDPQRYLTQEPGIYLAEARYLVDKRVALIASDTWALEVLSPAVTQGNAFPVHQELFGKFGCRIGESFVTDAAIDDDVYEGLLVITPENVPGATCGSSAPTLLGGRGRTPKD